MAASQNFYFLGEGRLHPPAQLHRLELEKDMLETSLASCVTYLQALRKKLARGAKRLDSDSNLPRKKKKKIQQSMRQLEKEIHYRERDEQACLNNLQACKASIYIAEIVSSPTTTVSSTLPDLESPTLCSYPEEPEPIEPAPTQFMFNPEAAVFSPLAVYKDHDVQLHQQLA